MDLDYIISEAKKNGFTLAEPLDCNTLILRPEVRDMCSADKCHAYGRNWTCPPYCGTIDECREKISKYKKGVIVQTTGYLEDDFDIETMQETARKHSDNLKAISQKVKAQDPNALILGAGGCKICPKCTCPDKPCRAPELAFSSMEGYGMVVSEVCAANNVPYNHGRGTLTYTGCILFEDSGGEA